MHAPSNKQCLCHDKAEMNAKMDTKEVQVWSVLCESLLLKGRFNNFPIFIEWSHCGGPTIKFGPCNEFDASNMRFLSYGFRSEKLRLVVFSVTFLIFVVEILRLLYKKHEASHWSIMVISCFQTLTLSSSQSSIRSLFQRVPPTTTTTYLHLRPPSLPLFFHHLDQWSRYWTCGIHLGQKSLGKLSMTLGTGFRWKEAPLTH